MLRGVRFRISRPTTFDMRHATCKTQHAGAVWYGLGRLAHQALRPPSRRGQRPRRRRQAAARGRRDRRQREGQRRVRSCCVFLFTLTQKGRMPCHVASRISHLASRISHVARRTSHVACRRLPAARCTLHVAFHRSAAVHGHPKWRFHESGRSRPCVWVQNDRQKIRSHGQPVHVPTCRAHVTF